MTMAAAMAAIGAKTLPKYAPKSFSIWGAQIKVHPPPARQEGGIGPGPPDLTAGRGGGRIS